MIYIDIYDIRYQWMGVYVYMSVRQWCFFSWMHIGDFYGVEDPMVFILQVNNKKVVYLMVYIFHLDAADLLELF